jgi:nucleotide-binding universal stress UspA family protein
MTTNPALIVVGVDGTAESDAALAFAIDEAARSRDALELVTAWDAESSLSAMDLAYGMVLSEPEHRAKEEAERQQQESLERVLGDRPQPTAVASQVIRGRPGPVLVEAARKARLLVVGTRSLGPVRAALLGSVSRYCAQHTTGALVVVPAPEHAPQTGSDELARPS